LLAPDSALCIVISNRSRVQGSILVPGLHLGCVFTGKASASSGLKQNPEPNRQLFAEMSIFDEDFRSLMLPLSLTLNHEPVGYCNNNRGRVDGTILLIITTKDTKILCVLRGEKYHSECRLMTSDYVKYTFGKNTRRGERNGFQPDR